MYCVEIIPLNKHAYNRLDNCINIAVMKIFNVKSTENVKYIRGIYNLGSIGNKACNSLWNFLRSVVFYNSDFSIIKYGILKIAMS